MANSKIAEKNDTDEEQINWMFYYYGIADLEIKNQRHWCELIDNERKTVIIQKYSNKNYKYGIVFHLLTTHKVKVKITRN